MCKSKHEMECYNKLFAQKPDCQNKCEGINANIIKLEISAGLEYLIPDIINKLPLYELYKRGFHEDQGYSALREFLIESCILSLLLAATSSQEV